MSYLVEQFHALQRTFPGTFRQGDHMDERGIYAFTVIGPSGRVSYFCAKKTSLDGIVSVHARLLSTAKQFNHTIVMSVAGEFYRFNPRGITSPPAWQNDRNGVVMTNFSLSLGYKIVAGPAPARSISPQTLEELTRKDPRLGEIVDLFGLQPT